mgnify:FL=1|tara:strand:+ start:2676 stop:3491 length:816 start_codon:yes stop_codon:yes gene_type:complete
MADVIWTNGNSDGDWANTANWLGGAIPTAGDNVYFTSEYTGDVTTNLDRTADGTLGNLIIEEGYTGKIGTKAGYLQLICSGVTFDGSGLCFIDVNTSAIDISVTGTARASTGQQGLYLKGSAIDELNVTGGTVGVAARAGETATVTTINVNGGTVNAGAGATLTTLTGYGGNMNSKAGLTTINLIGGNAKVEGNITTANLEAGTLTYNGTGTITTCNAQGGTIDCFRTALARTITTLNLKPNGGIVYDPDVVTVSTLTSNGNPISISSSNA